MKMRRWGLMPLALLLLTFAVPALAASGLEDPSRQIRAPQNRGAILEMKVLDSRGTPVSGAKITALGSDRQMREVVTNSSGEAVLDGLPTHSTGTVHANKAHKQNVNWIFELESGRINKGLVHYHVFTNTRYYRGNALVRQTWQPMVVQRPEINDDKAIHWKPVSFVGPVLSPSSRIVTPGAAPGAEVMRELSYAPHSAGAVTMARFRPSDWIAGTALQDMKMPVSTHWSIDTYNFVVKKVVTAPADAPSTAPAAPQSAAPDQQ